MRIKTNLCGDGWGRM